LCKNLAVRLDNSSLGSSKLEWNRDGVVVFVTRVKVIWRKATSLFYHIRQVAARVA